MSRAFFHSIILGSITTASVSLPVQSLAEQLPTVIVSAARTEQSTVTIPAAINIITQDQIEASGASNVSEVLRNQGGIYLTDLYGTGTHSKVAMRGFSSESAVSNTLVIVDGRRLNNIDISAPDLNSISIKDIERIEIIQGSAGTLYGDQAVGGVINIITKTPEKVRKEIELSVGSYDRRRVTAKIEDKLSEKISYRLTGDYLESDNYRDHNAQENFDVFGRLNYQLDDGQLFMEAQRVKADLELPGALSQAELDQNRRQSSFFDLDFSDSETEVLRFGLRKTLVEDWLAEVELTVRDQAIESVLWGGASQIKNEQIEFTPRIVGVYPLQYGDLTMTIGADLLTTDYAYDSASRVVTDEQQQQAFYAQLVWPIVDRISITLGGRHAVIENDVVSSTKTGVVDDSATVYEYGFSYSPNKNLRLFARVDENFRFAKVDELTYTSPGEELETQTGKSNELGIELKQSDYSIRAVFFRLNLKDEIAYDSTAPTPVGGLNPGANVNFDPTTHDGLIVDGSYQLTQSLGLNGSFTYNDAVFDSGVYKGNSISGVPEKSLLLNVDFNRDKNWRYYLEWAYTGELYVSGDNDNLQARQSNYSVVNASINYDQKAWHLSARINNLMNKEYSEFSVTYPPVYYYPSPERNFWLSAAYRF